MHFFTKELNSQESILILGEEKEEKLLVYIAFRVNSSLIKSISIQNPLKILEKFIAKFGLNLTIGNTTSKFIFEKEISIQPMNNTRLIEIKNPENHSFYTSAYVMITKQQTAKCAQVFCIDIDSYLTWLKRN